MATVANFAFNFSFFPVAIEPAADTVWLPGATGSGSYELVRAWATAFRALYPESDLTMTSLGSGRAQRAMVGKIDCFGENRVEAVCSRTFSDVQETLWGFGELPLDPKNIDNSRLLQLVQEQESYWEAEQTPPIIQLPSCASAVAIVYSKEVTKGKGPLRMTLDVLAKILDETIADWDHPLLQQLNPGLALPHERISKVVRSDASGETATVTKALGQHVPSWPRDAVGGLPNWRFANLVDLSEYDGRTSYCSSTTTNETDETIAMPPSFAANGRNGVALGLLRIPYSIGFLDMGHLDGLDDFLESVQIGTVQDHGDTTSASNFVEASLDSVGATMALLQDHRLDPQTLESNLVVRQGVTSSDNKYYYPMVAYSYWYLKASPDAYRDCYQAWLMARFVEWSYTDPQASELALAHGWVVPPRPVVEQALERLRESIRCYDTSVAPAPVIVSAMGYLPPPYRRPTERNLATETIIALVVAAVVVVVLVLLLWALDRRRMNRRLSRSTDFKRQKNKRHGGDHESNP